MISITNIELLPPCDICESKKPGMYYCTGLLRDNKDCYMKNQYYCMDCHD